MRRLRGHSSTGTDVRLLLEATVYNIWIFFLTKTHRFTSKGFINLLDPYGLLL